MGYFIFFGVLLINMIAISGCMQAPQISEVKQTIAEANITAPTLPVIAQPTLVSAVHPYTLSPIPKRTQDTRDPIIGRWTLNGNVNYQCDATFRDDKSGTVSCSAGYVPVLNEDVKWSWVDGDYTFMRTYEVLRGDGTIYTALYSYRTGALTSETFPENSYMIKVKP
jgi:hypothetical protein